MFAKVTDEQGFVHEEDFDGIFRSQMLTTCQMPSVIFLKSPIVFTLFDQNHDGVCDFTELAVGLSVLCLTDG